MATQSKTAPEGPFASIRLVAGAGFLTREHVLDLTPKDRRRA